MDFTFDDLLDEMRANGQMTPEKEAAAVMIKQTAQKLNDKYGKDIDEALHPFGK